MNEWKSMRGEERQTDRQTDRQTGLTSESRLIPKRTAQLSRRVGINWWSPRQDVSQASRSVGGSGGGGGGGLGGGRERWGVRPAKHPPDAACVPADTGPGHKLS